MFPCFLWYSDVGPKVVKTSWVVGASTTHFQSDEFRDEFCCLNCFNEVCILVFLEDVGFFKPGLIADGKFNEAYSFLFVVPEYQVWAEISMGDVRGKGIWLVVWEIYK